MPTISIVVPVYNTAKYLNACLDSIINQTFQDWELLLVDDGSNDGSVEICESYQKDDERIKIYYESHGGQSTARNLGIRKAKGTYLCFIDSDDYVVPEYLEKLYDIITRENVDLVSCEMRGESYLKNPDSKKEEVYSLFKTNQEIMAAYLSERPFSFGPVTKLYRRQLLEGIYFSEHKIYEDYFFNYQYFSKINTAIAIDFVGYFYVQNQSSTVRKPFDLGQLDNLTEQHKVIDEVIKSYSQYLPIAAYNLAWGYYWIISKCLYLIKDDKKQAKTYLNLIRKHLKKDRKLLKQAKPLKTKREKYLIKAVEYCPKAVLGAYSIKFYMQKKR